MLSLSIYNHEVGGSIPPLATTADCQNPDPEGRDFLFGDKSKFRLHWFFVKFGENYSLFQC